MVKFFSKINTRRKEDLIAFLKTHTRYHTMNSWNCMTSYANCVKIHRMGLSGDRLDKAFEMLNMPQVYSAINYVLDAWAMNHSWQWQVGFNGRSSGYLVLYRGKLDYTNTYTAVCDTCGKHTWHKENIPCTVCGAGMLIVQNKPIPQISTCMGDVDQDVDFADWSMDGLRSRVRLVQEFDKLCDLCLSVFVDYCDNYDIVDEDIVTTKTIQSLKLKSADNYDVIDEKIEVTETTPVLKLKSAAAF